MPINSFQFRRETPESAAAPGAEKLDGDTDDREDNWISNFMAWASRVFLPSWCDTPGHWSSRSCSASTRPALAACSSRASQSG